MPVELAENRRVERTENFQHPVIRQLAAAIIKRCALIEQRQAVPHRTIRCPGDIMKRLLLDADLFPVRHFAKPAFDGGNAEPSEVIALAAREDGRRQPVRLRRAQDEDDVFRRLLERLQKRVERRGAQHMDLVDDEDFLLPLRRRVCRLIDHVPDIVDAVVRCRIHLDHVKTRVVRNRPAHRTLSARISVVRILTVDSLRKNFGDGRLARATCAAEKITVADAVRDDLVFQCAHDRVAPAHIIKGLRSVLPIERKIPCRTGHE